MTSPTHTIPLHATIAAGSKKHTHTHPQPNPFTTIQPAATVIHATNPDTMPTNAKILSDPNLFMVHITEIDKALNSFPNSNFQNPLTQLAPSIVMETSILPFLSSTKSAIPSIENTDILTTTHIDMNKAFDRVEWRCLKDIMLKMGFSDKWVNIMMLCVTSVTYSIQINEATSPLQGA